MFFKKKIKFVAKGYEQFKQIKSHFCPTKRSQPKKKKRSFFFRPSKIGHMIPKLRLHFLNNWKIFTFFEDREKESRILGILETLVSFNFRRFELPGYMMNHG